MAALLPCFLLLPVSLLSDEEDSSSLLEESLDPDSSEAPLELLPELELDELEEDELEELLELNESYFISSSYVFDSSGFSWC